MSTGSHGLSGHDPHGITATFLEWVCFIAYQDCIPMSIQSMCLSRSGSRLVRLCAVLLLSVSPFVAYGEEEAGEKGGPPQKHGMSEERERWESLSKEEQERLRTALREVWTDPSVLSAREEVRQATEDYQRAVRAAIVKSDPELGRLLSRAQSHSEGRMQERMGSGGFQGGRMGMRRPGEYSMGPPAFLESLTPEERARFEKAEKAAQASEGVLSAKQQFEALRKEDEALRRKRLDAHRKLRKAILDGMLAEDPALKERIDELRAVPKMMPKGGVKGKGKPPKES